MAKDKMQTSPPEYKPRLYIDLEKGDIKLVEKLTVGDDVTLIIQGKVCGLERSESTDEDGKKRERGNLRIEDYHVKATGENEFSKLAEDD